MWFNVYIYIQWIVDTESIHQWWFESFLQIVCTETIHLNDLENPRQHPWVILQEVIVSCRYYHHMRIVIPSEKLWLSGLYNYYIIINCIFCCYLIIIIILLITCIWFVIITYMVVLYQYFYSDTYAIQLYLHIWLMVSGFPPGHWRCIHAGDLRGSLCGFVWQGFVVSSLEF